MKRKLLLLIGMCCLLIGCGKQTDLIEEIEDVELTKAFEASQNETGMESEYHIAKTMDSFSGGRSFILDADIDYTGTENAQIYSVDRIDVNEDYLKDLAEKLFDDGQYRVMPVYEYWSKENLELELQSMYQDDKSVEDGRMSSTMIKQKLEQLISQPYHEKGLSIPSDKIIYEDTELAGLKTALLCGNINGKPYELIYYSGVAKQNLLVVPQYPVSNYMSQNTIESDKFDELYGDNKCNLEEARSVANSYFEKLKLDDFEEFCVTERVCNNSVINGNEYNGYIFYYTRNMNGFPIPLVEQRYIGKCGLSMKTSEFEGEEEYVAVAVDDSGFVDMDINVVYKNPEVISEKTKLLSREQVQKIVEDYLVKEDFNIDDDDDMHEGLRNAIGQTINSIRLTYVPQYMYDKIVFMPVWLYSYDSSFSNISQINAVIGVGAIEGELYCWSNLDLPNYWEFNAKMYRELHLTAHE